MINQLHLAMIELYKGDAKRIQHFCKVHSYAKLIAETENVDKNCQFIIEAAALTHDIGIHICEEKYGSCNDYQILVEADFLVNIMEEGSSKEAAIKAYQNIFKTSCGKKICREMFGI